MTVVHGSCPAPIIGSTGIWGFVDFSGPSTDAPWILDAAHRFGAMPTSGPAGRCVTGSFGAGRSDKGVCHPSFTLAADGELHNRDELMESLGMPRAESKHQSDVELIAAAYEKWGEDCPNFLLGEYSFAIWDSRKEKLILCRDHIGFRPLYYWREGSRFAFASDLRCLFQVPGVERRLNRRKLSAMTVAGGQHLVPEETFHDGILSVPSSGCVRVDCRGVRQSTYWKPEIRTNLVPKRPEEAFEALRELLFRAVECRIRGSNRVAALLSGGLDSSSVVSIAARCLAGNNRTLTTMSSVLPEMSEIADERAFIAEYQSIPNIRMEYITAPGKGPFDFIEESGRCELTPLQTSRHFMYQAFDDAAAASGCDMILDGAGGEMGPTCWGDGYYVELAAGFRWITLAGELAKRRAVSGRSPVRVLGRDLMNVLPDRQRREIPIVLLANEFKDHRARTPMRPFRWPSQRRSQLDLMGMWLRKHAVWAATGMQRRARYSQPLRDKRIFEFCVAAPGNLKIRNGYPRYLVRGAMEGILPKKIQWRTDKLPFSPDYYIRYNAQVGKAREFVAAIRGNDPVRSVVDVEQLSQLIQPVNPAVGGARSRDLVPGSIYLICFLRQFAEFRA
jgi:asparagine synthase (glutamine-hydrolysing)